jgi:hypothetical protein
MVTRHSGPGVRSADRWPRRHDSSGGSATGEAVGGDWFSCFPLCPRAPFDCDKARRPTRPIAIDPRHAANASLFGSGNSAGKKFSEARDRGGIFSDIGRFRATETGIPPRLLRQSRGKSKTIPMAPGTNRLCGPKAIISDCRRTLGPTIDRQNCGPIDMAPPVQAPSRWHRADRSRQ